MKIQEFLSFPPCSAVRMVRRLAVSPTYESLHFLFAHLWRYMKLLKCFPSSWSLMLNFVDSFVPVWTMRHAILSGRSLDNAVCKFFTMFSPVFPAYGTFIVSVVFLSSSSGASSGASFVSVVSSKLLFL